MRAPSNWDIRRTNNWKRLWGNQMEIQKDASVVIEYAIKLADGSIVKGEREPVSLHFIVGYEQVLPALEQRLRGLQEGERRQFVIPAAVAFGEHRANLVKTRSFEEFPEGRDLESGKWVVAISDRTGTRYGYRVVEKSADAVVLDYNHPLAGQDLHYDVKVIKVRPALQDELEYLRPCEYQDDSKQ